MQRGFVSWPAASSLDETFAQLKAICARPRIYSSIISVHKFMQKITPQLFSRGMLCDWDNHFARIARLQPRLTTDVR